MSDEELNSESSKQQIDDQRQSERRSQSEEPMLFCPVCDQRLTSQKCKLICEQCGYFMSCADYY